MVGFQNICKKPNARQKEKGANISFCIKKRGCGRIITARESGKYDHLANAGFDPSAFRCDGVAPTIFSVRLLRNEIIVAVAMAFQAGCKRLQKVAIILQLT